MKSKLSGFLDTISTFFEKRKGFLPLLGLVLIILNFFITLFSSNWLAQTNFFLHLGLIFVILGFLIAWAL